MKYRKLRIAWSVAWGVMAALVVLLCVRSYRAADTVVWRHQAGHAVRVQSCLGSIRVAVVSDKPRRVLVQAVLDGLAEVERAEPSRYSVKVIRGRVKKYDIHSDFVDDTVGSALPHWIVALCCAALAVVPWVRHITWRFSLRTLFIVLTVLAVELGLAVYVSR
jgi:hypothetical protein